MVEVFKTNVRKRSAASELIRVLQQLHPDHRINFDLADRDKILRVESPDGKIDAEKIRCCVQSAGYEIEILSD